MFCWTNFNAKKSYILELACLFDHFLVRKMRHIMLFFIACMYTYIAYFAYFQYLPYVAFFA